MTACFLLRLYQSLLLHGIFYPAGSILNLTSGLLCRAFSLGFLVTCHFANGFFHSALSLVGRTLNAIRVHCKLLIVVDD